MRVTIDRKRWDRGHTGRLKDVETGKMCILGHCLAAAGVPEDAFLGKSVIMDLDEYADRIPKWMVRRDGMGLTPVADDMVTLNDTRQFDDDADREGRLIRLAASVGVVLEFV